MNKVQRPKFNVQSSTFKVQSNRLLLKDVRLFAFHGVLEQERAVGAYYTLNVVVDTDFSHAMATDELEGTISYADIYEVVKREMAVPSQLLEHVAGRICTAIFNTFPAATRIQLDIIKENPPMGADCRGAGVAIDVQRS